MFQSSFYCVIINRKTCPADCQRRYLQQRERTQYFLINQTSKEFHQFPYPGVFDFQIHPPGGQGILRPTTQFEYQLNAALAGLTDTDNRIQMDNISLRFSNVKGTPVVAAVVVRDHVLPVGPVLVLKLYCFPAPDYFLVILFHFPKCLPG